MRDVRRDEMADRPMCLNLGLEPSIEARRGVHEHVPGCEPQHRHPDRQPQHAEDAQRTTVDDPDAVGHWFRSLVLTVCGISK